VTLLFILASVAVPTLQSLLASSAQDLPLGLDNINGLVYWLTIVAGLVVLFGALCITYAVVPKGSIPWSSVWPGALGATLAMGIVDWAFPLYLTNISRLRVGTSAVFVLIALVWFYVLSLIVLSGAVVNELRRERVRSAETSVPEEPDAATDAAGERVPAQGES
jgi:membrane protein